MDLKNCVGSAHEKMNMKKTQFKILFNKYQQIITRSTIVNFIVLLLSDLYRFPDWKYYAETVEVYCIMISAITNSQII